MGIILIFVFIYNLSTLDKFIYRVKVENYPHFRNCNR